MLAGMIAGNIYLILGMPCESEPTGQAPLARSLVVESEEASCEALNSSFPAVDLLKPARFRASRANHRVYASVKPTLSFSI
jgi:hypothetical protein